MVSYAGQLRQARAEVLPLMDDLVPELADDKRVILDALQDVFAKNGNDPSNVSSNNWNKVERHTIVGHFIAKQAGYLVEDSGHDARFRNFLTGSCGQRTPETFESSLLKTQAAGAEYAKYESTIYGYSLAAKRYRRLGMAAFLRAGIAHREGSVMVIGAKIPKEGVFLHSGLRTKALASAVEAHMMIMRPAVEELPEGERLLAAHDLAYLTSSVASLHFIELKRVLSAPDIKAVKDMQAGRYRAVNRDMSNGRMLFQRVGTLPSERLKCPAHVRPRDSVGEIADYSPMQNMFHAAINAAVELGYYRL